MTKVIIMYVKISSVILFCTLISGCATNPEKLQTPVELTCIFLKEPLSTTGLYGPLNVEWTTRLERGPYWSEKIDEKGTFFRGAPGSISIRSPDYPSIPGQPAATDGGFYLPKDPKEPVKIYRYFTTKAVPVEVPSDNVTCNTLAYTKESASHKVSLVSFATAGAVGGATGAIIGKNFSSGNMSYGKAAGAGAAGGAIGGLIVAAIINAEVGKIIGGLPIKESSFMEKLRELGAKREPLKQISLLPASSP